MAINNPGANTRSGQAVKPSACEPFVRPGQVAPDRLPLDACMRCGRPESDHHAGPFETERQALDTPAVRAVYTAFEAAPGLGRMQPPNLAMLRAACEGADVELGAYDLRILAWLAGWEPQVCAVVAGLITRAGSHGEAVRP
jgi:hypothetical protein